MKNKNFSRSPIALLLAACMIGCAALFGACGSDEAGVEVSGRGIMHEDEFGGVYVDLSIDGFNEYGFKYGDSVDVTFSNGYKLEGIPYYNGYYTQTGDPLLIAYPGYPYVKVCINNGDDLWEVASLSDDDKADISLSESGKFLKIQEARDIHYKDDRSLFPDDAVFANFRAIDAGNIKSGVLYRSASPCDNQHNRAPYVDKLIDAAGVKCIVDLADNEEKIYGYIEKEDFDSPYFLALFEDGDVIPLALNMNFSSDDFRSKITAGLIEMTKHEGPYLVHCTEGKDRTGFVCMLLEALCGASYGEIADDYMITYDNYYQISKTNFSDKYDVIVEDVLDPMIRSVVGDDTVDIKSADLSEYAKSFLLGAGMTDEQITTLKDLLGGK